MSDEVQGKTTTGETKTPDEIREEIARTRAELGDTVEELTAKLDVKAHAQEKVDAAKEKVHEAAEKVREKTPDPVLNAAHATGEKVGPVVHSAADKAKPYRKQILLGGGAVAAVLWIVKKRRSAD